MKPAITNQGGVAIANGPDTCKLSTPTGPVPTPLFNTAMLNQASGVSTKVKFGGKNVVTIASKVPTSIGDETGSLGGVISNKIKGECTFKVGSPTVRVEGKMPVRQGDPCGMNGVVQNTMGTVAGPGCVTVMLA